MTPTDAPPLVVVCEVYPMMYGAQRSMLQMYERWHQERAFRAHFLYFVEGDLSEAVARLGIPCTRLPVGPLLGSFNKKLLRLRWWEYPALAFELIGLNRRVYRFLREVGAAMIHFNNDRVGLMCFLGARWAKCPTVTHLRRDTSFGWRDRLIYRKTDEIIWVSRRICDDFARNHRISRPKGRVIFDGRELSDRDAGSTALEIRKEFGWPVETRIVLYVASFDERKDHETLVAAAAAACAKEPTLRFLLAGGDFTANQERTRKIKDLVAAARLTDRVRFLGHRTDIGRLMRGSDVLVNAAREEALGGSLIEALAYGLPSVATDVGGTAEIVPDGQCGFLVPPGQPEPMARRILDLIGDEPLRRRLAANARRRFEEHFTMTKCVEQTAEFFREVIEGSAQGTLMTHEPKPLGHEAS